ncbi:MAG: HAMP domain-containing protein [Planctomycetes bacterium]|nr:HAMP domain-containing protein [Planctomycetota bacterium]
MNQPVVPAERDRPSLRDRLAFRFALALCLGATVILAAAGLWNVSLQRRHMTDLVRSSADRTGDIILRSLRTAMLDNAPDEVNRILETVGAQRGIDRIRIFDKQGRIQKSTRENEVGHLVDKQAEQCFVCHQAGQPIERLEGMDRVRIFRDADQHRILSVIVPVRNEADCSSAICHAHPKGQSVLGVLDVQLSLDAVDERISSSERQLALGHITSVAAVVLLAGFLVWRMVIRPVRLLATASTLVAKGDMTTRVAVTSKDEIGRATSAWNDMVLELSKARTELETWSKTLEARVEQAKGELETAHKSVLLSEKMASLGKLSAVVAHELNNPLAGIATYAKLLKKQAEKRAGDPPSETDAATIRALDLVETEALRCGGIVRNLLVFSRTPGSRFADEDVAPLLERCALLVHHQAQLLDVDVAVEIEPGLPRASCDASQVQQMVLALTMNALEAMPDGGRVVLRAAADPVGTSLRIQVADTGSGIAEADLPHVFEPFFTTKQDGKGVGLGLAVVYGIVQRHGGRIDIESKVGIGTTFTVLLPLKRPDVAAADVPAVNAPPVSAPPVSAPAVSAPAVNVPAVERGGDA